MSLKFSAEMNNVNAREGQRLEGVLDSTYLFAYAFFMFFRYQAFK